MGDFADLVNGAFSNRSHQLSSEEVLEYYKTKAIIDASCGYTGMVIKDSDSNCVQYFVDYGFKATKFDYCVVVNWAGE